MMDDRACITKDEFWALSEAERNQIEFYPNTWEYDQATDSWINRWHPDNETWRLEKEAAEARAFL